MQITREMRIGAGALAFVGVLAWMIPPTQPVAPAVGERLRAQGGASIATDAANATKYAPPPGAVTATPPAPSIDEEGGDYNRRETEEPMPSAEVARPAQALPEWRDPPSGFSRNGEAGGDRAAARDPGYMLGYRWAADNQVERARDCRIWRGSPAEDGCRFYLREVEETDPRDGAPWQQ